MLVTGLKTAVSAASAGGAVHIFRRTPPMQRRQIRRSLERAARELPAPALARGPFPRARELATLVAFLRSPPVGPLVVTGPEGAAGRQVVIQAALAASRTPLLLLVNMSEHAPSRARPFLWQLVRASGHYQVRRPSGTHVRAALV